MSGPPVIQVRLSHPGDPHVRELIAELDAVNLQLYPPESCYLDSPEELARQQATVLAAYADGRPVGCGAVKFVEDWAELKRLYVRPEYRRLGIAKLLLSELEQIARDAKRRLMRLETGVHQKAAIAFYERGGYRPTGRFHPYQPDPLSIYLERDLSAE